MDFSGEWITRFRPRRPSRAQLAAAIHYNRGKVYLRQMLTHSEYDKGAWKK
jgi:mRNA-degrading endonuclease HigB of HigAB toxin-antitoxin module